MTMNNMEYKNDTLCVDKLDVGDNISYYQIESPEFINATIDSSGKIINSITKDGHTHIDNLESKSIDSKFDKVYEEISSISTSSPDELGVTIELPPEIIAVVGDTLQLYYYDIINASNYRNYFIEIGCSIGRNYPRYYELTPEQSQVGNTYTFTVNVLKNDMSILKTRTTTLKVVDKLTSPETNKNILIVGASCEAPGIWPAELRRRLTETSGDGTSFMPTGLGLDNISFIGRKISLQVDDMKLEATGGWSWQTYVSSGVPAFRFHITVPPSSSIHLKDMYWFPDDDPYANQRLLIVEEINMTEGIGNIRCAVYGGWMTPTTIVASGTIRKYSGDGPQTITYSSYEYESFNPFYNNSTEKLDFQNYCSLYCENSPIDYMIVCLGINGLSYGHMNSQINDAKKFLRAFHNEETGYPNGKVLLTLNHNADPTGGCADGGISFNSRKYYDMNRILNNLYIDLSNDSEFSSYVRVAPVCFEFDSENSLPKGNKRVNVRNERFELIGTNSVHPTQQGDYQISDVMYRTLSGFINL